MKQKYAICTVFAYFERQTKKEKVSSSPLICTVKATGSSQAMVTWIERKQSRLPGGVELSFVTPCLLFHAQVCSLHRDFLFLMSRCHVTVIWSFVRINSFGTSLPALKYKK